jgi:hypothetical protein
MRRRAARVVLALGLGVLVLSCSRPSGVEIRIRVIDGPTGEVTPAMVAIVSMDDESLRLPPDGDRYQGGGSQVSEFHWGIAFDPDPNWIGAVRKMSGIGDNEDRSYVYGPWDSLPYWWEDFSYSTSGRFSIRLEPGRYRLNVARGTEYVPVREELEVSADRSMVEKTVVLERWTNPPALGWYSGDIHVHHNTTRPEFREFVLHYARAEDVHLVNVLTMGRPDDVLMPQDVFGRPECDETGRYCLISGQEDPRSFFGHVTGSRIRQPARFADRYDLYDVTLEEIRRQGGLVGIAHYAFNGGGTTTRSSRFRRYWYLTTGLVDFVELLQYRTLNTSEYYDHLDLGFRLTAAAGSDIPWGSTLGDARTYVYTGPSFDVDSWFAGLEAGHTFVTNGPMLEFHVDGRLAGSEIQVEKGHRARVELAVTGHPAIGLPRHLRLVGSDGLISESFPDATDPSRIEAIVDVEVLRSQWLAVSTECYNGAVAHSSPVYLIVGGEPSYHPGKGPAIVDRHLDSLGELQREVAAWRDHPNQEELLVRLARAADYYRALKERITASTQR